MSSSWNVTRERFLGVSKKILYEIGMLLSCFKILYTVSYDAIQQSKSAGRKLRWAA